MSSTTSNTTEADAALEQLVAAYQPGKLRFRPEESPFRTLFADITHRCNMACRNCYIPVRDLPDLPVEWLSDILSRLPRRTRIRLVGAEPTMREDLPSIISRVRALGHIPIILSNGLKLGRMSYVQKLKKAGLGTVYLSLNGGLKDELYLAIDELACAERKMKALANLQAAKLHVTTGTILVPGVNDAHLKEFLPWLLAHGVNDIHLRSVGEMGSYMEGKSIRMVDLEAHLRASVPDESKLEFQRSYGSSRDFRYGRAQIQLTEWPELASLERGRITPDGMVEPMFESIMANEFRY
jgi:molybdenum cofactor biosynthesis enzyme MoaA